MTDLQPDQPFIIRHEEELIADKRTRDAGKVRVHKRVESRAIERQVPRSIEHYEVERVPPADEDSGEIESLPDGSISVPLFGEEIVVDKRRVVRERVIVRKEIATEQRVVTDERRIERISAEEE
jgi:uncharacterized protein (TIGR02271 family)